MKSIKDLTFLLFFINLPSINADGCRNYRIDDAFEGSISNCPELKYENGTRRLIRNPFEGCRVRITRGDITCGSEETRCYDLKTMVKIKNIYSNETKLITFEEMLDFNGKNEKKWLIETRKNYFEEFWFSHYVINSESKFYKLIMDDDFEMTLTPSHNVILKNGTLIMSRRVNVGTTLKGNKTIISKKVVYKEGYANLISDSGEFLIYSNNKTMSASCYAHISNKFLMNIIYRIAKYSRNIWQIKNTDGELLINSVGLFFQNFFI